MTEKKEKNVYLIPEEGSLGLLALGDLGLIAWRKKRKEAQSKVKQAHNKIKKNNEQ